MKAALFCRCNSFPSFNSKGQKWQARQRYYFLHFRAKCITFTLVEVITPTPVKPAARWLLSLEKLASDKRKHPEPFSAAQADPAGAPPPGPIFCRKKVPKNFPRVYKPILPGFAPPCPHFLEVGGMPRADTGGSPGSPSENALPPLAVVSKCALALVGL